VNNKRQKRAPNEQNELVEAESLIYATFTPNLWEEIIIAKYESGNNYETFKEKFKDKLNEYYYTKNNFTRWQNKVDTDILIENIFNNWDNINSNWRYSDKTKRIRIICHNYTKNDLRSSHIRMDDSISYENKYLNKQIINEILTNNNLGKLFNINEQTILDSIKLKNPDIDISYLSVSDIKNTSAKININKTGKYSIYSWINVYFQKPDLITDFKWCIDPVNDIDDQTILNAIKTKNPDLDISQVYVKEKVIGGQLEIGVKENSNKYNTNKSVWCNNFKVKSNLNKIIKNYNLNIINNSNSDKTLLNELNYLNPNLDISQLEIINKTNTSAIIKTKANNEKYFNEKKIYYSLNNQQNKIINLNELIKKAIFFKFRDDNPNLIFKETKNINTNNLIYSNVTATKNIEPIYQKSSKSICFGTTTLFNNSSEKRNMKTPNCKYTKETTISTQITTSLSKTDSEEKNTEQSSSSNIKNSLNIELSASGGMWPFSEVSATIGAEKSYESSTTNSSSETKTLSNTFDFSNNKTNEYKESSEIELPSQEISVNPNQKIKITASLEEITAQVTLNLKQNINGEINSKIITLNNEEKTITLSIKEIMQKLKQYDLLPQEITINNDNSITFNGKASRSLKQGFNGNITFHEVN
ncbi:ETX/MTX2 family pore-forming toxin, partial [Spiroplasma phoeniceum]|uniref:ETX/MTX2 family pore-forming toxin n=1 Tax=Spiroplasma phoeniceum TaxID=47835 RepID=UPI003365037D